MQIHQLKLKSKKPKRKRVGRGGKKGTYSGRGIKGQKARAGKKPRIGFAGGDTSLAMRLPKKRGIIGKVGIRRGPKLGRYKKQVAAINLTQLDKHFKEGELVTPKTLLNKGVIDKIKGRVPNVKVLNIGKLAKSLVYRGISFSQEARDKVGVKITKPKAVKKPKQRAIKTKQLAEKTAKDTKKPKPAKKTNKTKPKK